MLTRDAREYRLEYKQELERKARKELVGAGMHLARAIDIMAGLPDPEPNANDLQNALDAITNARQELGTRVSSLDTCACAECLTLPRSERHADD